MLQSARTKTRTNANVDQGAENNSKEKEKQKQAALTPLRKSIEDTDSNIENTANNNASKGIKLLHKKTVRKPLATLPLFASLNNTPASPPVTASSAFTMDTPTRSNNSSNNNNQQSANSSFATTTPSLSSAMPSASASIKTTISKSERRSLFKTPNTLGRKVYKDSRRSPLDSTPKNIDILPVFGGEYDVDKYVVESAKKSIESESLSFADKLRRLAGSSNDNAAAAVNEQSLTSSKQQRPQPSITKPADYSSENDEDDPFGFRKYDRILKESGLLSKHQQSNTTAAVAAAATNEDSDADATAVVQTSTLEDPTKSTNATIPPVLSSPSISVSSDSSPRAPGQAKKRYFIDTLAEQSPSPTKKRTLRTRSISIISTSSNSSSTINKNETKRNSAGSSTTVVIQKKSRVKHNKNKGVAAEATDDEIDQPLGEMTKKGDLNENEDAEKESVTRPVRQTRSKKISYAGLDV
ncbi:hypothetical protein HK100_004232 [Physocladia obscura]|uniref:Uncharacterized protein n=1 Tax=Physocladia obscura TaxID=109957 RepID=A0AAD5SW16_9FUNG|nr:hypothetical protein HK100_004232 [Physocladia obscura]